MADQDAFAAATVAVRGGDVDELERLLGAHRDLAAYEAHVGHPSLLQLVACEEASLSAPLVMAELLLEAGADAGPPLVAAAGCNSPGTLGLILDAGTHVDAGSEWTPLDEALYWNHMSIVRTLIERGASPGRLRRAAGTGDVTLLHSFYDPPHLRETAGPLASPFPDTITPGQADDPQALVDHAFVMAVNCGQQATAQVLLDAGAQVNASPPGYHWRGTALHAAVWRGHAAVVSWLLEVGADPSIRDGLAHSNAAGWAKHHNRPAIEALLAT